MNILPKPIAKVIESFERLPGIGPKTATRLAFYLLHVPQEDLTRFADSLQMLKASTVLCSHCKNVSEHDPCPICSDPTRDQTIICVVEQSTDILSLEKTGKFHGLYHVLHGAIDPLNNIGPDEIYIAALIKRIRSRHLLSAESKSGVKEIIIATNPNMEGEATAMYINNDISKLALGNADIVITRLAHGLPVGADIEYADDVTLSRALEGRRAF